MYSCDQPEVLESNLEVQEMNPQQELSSVMETKEKIDVHILDPNEITDEMNAVSSFVSSLTEVEDLTKLHKWNGMHAGNEKYDQDENEVLFCRETILEEPKV